MDRTTSRNDMAWCWTCNARHRKVSAGGKHTKRLRLCSVTSERDFNKETYNPVYKEG